MIYIIFRFSDNLNYIYIYYGFKFFIKLGSIIYIFHVDVLYLSSANENILYLL